MLNPEVTWSLSSVTFILHFQRDLSSLVQIADISPDNLPMLRLVAARTFNLILLDTAASAKYVKIVACQLSNVHHSTGVPLFFRALRKQPQQEYQIKGLCLGGKLPILLYIILD
jgi:hypothetical protein